MAMSKLRRNQYTVFATDENGVEREIKTFDIETQALTAEKILLEGDSTPKIVSTRIEKVNTVVDIDFKTDAEEKRDFALGKIDPNPLHDL